MKYQVTYRLSHPEYLPATSTSLVEARSHAELEMRLAGLLRKWRAAGYTVRVLAVRPARGKWRERA
jgi:hypothetical protein